MRAARLNGFPVAAAIEPSDTAIDRYREFFVGTKLRVSDGGILVTEAVGHNPRGLAVDGTHLLVASFAGNTVEQRGLETAEYQHNYGFIRSTDAVLFDGVNTWVMQSRGVTKITPRAQ